MKKIYLSIFFLPLILFSCSSEDNDNINDTSNGLVINTHKPKTKSKIIAHRGYWNIDGSAQNSITALKFADGINAYGSEFDVYLTKDDHLVINHDPTVEGHDIQHTTLKVLRKVRLSNKEILPTLEEYFEAAKSLKTQLILELKPHQNNERETKAIEKIIALAKQKGVDKKVEYISFSLHAVKEFIRLAPKDTPVYYLGGNKTPKELKKMGCAGLDYSLSVLKQHPEWIKESQELGLKVNCWTVRTIAQTKWAADLQIDFITTDIPATAINYIKSNYY